MVSGPVYKLSFECSEDSVDQICAHQRPVFLWLQHNSRSHRFIKVHHLNSSAIDKMAVGVCMCDAVLIEEATAASRRAVAMQLVVLVLNGELVVVGELFTAVDLPQGENYDVLSAVHVDDAGVAVGLARVVDEAGRVALHRRVHHVKVVDAEHVAADVLAVIILLSLVSQDRADDGASVLDHHLPGLDVPLTVKSTSMNLRSVNSYCFFGYFLQVPESHRHGKLTAGGSPRRFQWEFILLFIEGADNIRGLSVL